ncbi:MAG: hypothetical protein IJL38_01110 [Bacteroidales bacterium]|nr:hypothetical protein [Bacteroidales bacterium]
MECTEIISTIIAAVALVVSIVSLVCSKQAAKKSLQMNIFNEFTRRYQEITMGLMSDHQNEVKYQRLYIDLCSEEYYLNKKDCLPKEVWKMWLEGMIIAVKVDSLKTAWTQYRGLYDPGFQGFFDNLIKESNK